MTLQEIYAPIEKELSLVKERLKIKENELSCLSEILEYIHLSKGKLIRPALFLFATKLDGNFPINLATSIELIHSASLLHDDIIDGSLLRRHKETIVSKWGKDWALLVGDLFLAEAFNILVNYGDMRIIKLFTQGCLFMCKGQMLELERGMDIDEEMYLRIIYQKTAHLFELSCKAGAMVGNNNVERLSNYGKNLGLGFQIIDDLLDLETGNDLKNKRSTLPVIYTLRVADKKDKAMFEEADLVGKKEIIKKYNGISYSRNLAKAYLERAKEEIRGLSFLYSTSLLSLCDFVLERKE